VQLQIFFRNDAKGNDLKETMTDLSSSRPTVETPCMVLFSSLGFALSLRLIKG